MAIIWSWKVSEQSNISSRADRVILDAFENNEGIFSPQDLPTQDYPKITRTQLQKLMSEGHVTLNEKPLQPNSKLKMDSQVEIHFPKLASLDLVPEKRPLDILFEDAHLLVVNKPPGLTVHPSPTQLDDTLVHALLHHIPDLKGIGGVLRPGIVHRIDKDTSGALVISKSSEAHQGLVQIFAKHDIERKYWAFCYGSPEKAPRNAPIKIETLIARNPKDRKKMSSQVKTGKEAISYYRRLEEYSVPEKKPFASWLEVTLETGRTHQIRVHLTGLGYSIMGDPAYGTPTSSHFKWNAVPRVVQKAIDALPGQALHARTLGFKHPITNEQLFFEASLPPALEHLTLTLQKFNGKSDGSHAE